MDRLARYLPVLDWGRRYDRQAFLGDALAAAIVTVMLIPQSLAYAMLAGLPPVVGLYASILPLVAYALFGTSRTLAVGPVAVVSLLTATAAGTVAAPGSAEYVAAALALALLSGVMLVAMGVLRLGFVANLLSHPVISGFITASGLLIAASQLQHILGVRAGGHTLVDLGGSLVRALPDANVPTLVVGLAATAFLAWARKGLRPALQRLGLSAGTAALLSRTGPVVAVAVSILAVVALGLEARGVAVVGDVPQGLPPLALPPFDPALWAALVPAAFLISIIGFAESVSVAQTLAAKRRQSIKPDQELIGLGAANLAAAISGGYPVTGGFARSVVNFDAGAETPAAGAYTAGGIALASLVLTPLLAHLPTAVLAATIIVAVLSLVDLGALRRTWAFSRFDFAAMAGTILVTLGFGVEAGIVTGVALSVLLHLWRTSRPHVAVIGQIPGTHHFRNVRRHDVVCSPEVLGLRIDESLYFANARAIEAVVQEAVAERPEVRHVVLNCAAVNGIDASALESLELIMHRLHDAGIRLHLSEVKGPVMDRLARSDFVDALTGRIFLSHHEALAELAPETTRDCDAAVRPPIDAGRTFPERTQRGR
ncbi:SulP family inorganic anion transporter [Wenxinia marina]|uniref:High affinity sulfate transporter 1 n=1 Tax=Wenxinia marina DSM 24838 TaxID=1123501 RepID=A0A0D0QAQ5_9RHOB|nr:sulfate permease [Wenxinia marina]KIQ69392.1 high affinity sulfate transporter 1 [Wenxinia marina DSM 24838]GGL57953.1 sodium-independent anion transporter [Wenxinia marina]